MASFLEVHQWIERTYGARNDKIGVESVLESTDAALSRLSKAARKGPLNPAMARVEISRIVARDIALAAMLGVDVVIGMREKYRGYCPYCRYTVCRCGIDEPAAEPPVGIPLMRVNAPVHAFQIMFGGIYTPRNRQAGEKEIILHLFEEVAEVRRAKLRDLHRRGVQEELSDVMAHSFGLANLFPIDVDDVLEQRYRDGCPECHLEVCGCPLDQ